jgi:hypothetical protein
MIVSFGGRRVSEINGQRQRASRRRERAKVVESCRDSDSCLLRGTGFVLGTLINIATVGENHAVDHRSKVRIETATRSMLG